MSRAFASGSSQYLGSSGSPVSTYPFSISAWYTPTATAQDVGIVGLGNGADRHVLYQNQQSVAMYSQTGAAAGDQSRFESLEVAAGLLSHVGGAVGSAASRKVYLNGVQAPENTASFVTGPLDSFLIGAAHQQASASPYLFGNAVIAEVGVWDVELTAEEWTSLAAGCSPLLIRPARLRGYWPLLGRAAAEESWVGELQLTNVNAAAVAEHVRIIEPWQRLTLFSSAAASGTSVSPAPGSLILTGYAPTIASSVNQQVSPSAGTLALTGYAPTITQGVTTVISPTPGTLTLSGYSPTLTQTQNTLVTPGAGQLHFTGYAPSIERTFPPPAPATPVMRQVQQALPPTPPLTSEGFGASTWQRWLDIMRKRLTESYSPGNPPPDDGRVGASPAAIGELQQQLSEVLVQVSLLEGSASAIAALWSLAAILGEDAYFADLLVTGELLVKKKAKLEKSLEVAEEFGCNGKLPQAAFPLPAAATNLATAQTLVNAIRDALIANGTGS